MFTTVLSMGAETGILTLADPEPPAPKTARDLERLAAAEAKRARKAARKAA